MLFLRSSNAPIGALSLIGMFFGYDLINDLLEGDLGSWHFWVEAFMFGMTITVLWTQIRQLRSLNSGLRQEQDKVSRLSGELLSRIHQRFAEWKLSKSEQEVGLLLIRGFSMKEIAEIRRVKEKTSRQQATSLYAKSGLANRNELTSHFIDDLISEAFRTDPPKTPSG